MLPEALARALVCRGVDTFDDARRYFRGTLADLHDPFLMQDMDQAADRVVRAIKQKEKVAVYGDYDADGITSAALLTHFLRSRHVDADFFIPDRFQHGYGVHTDGIDWATEAGASLMIAVDCGVTALEEATYAREKGIDLIVCDHHMPLESTPEAVAVLDPKRPSCPYPFKDLSACGVAFKLVQAALVNLGESSDEARAYLDLVALSTTCDIVPLQGENRILVREGLRQMRQGGRRGLNALAETAGKDIGDMDARGLGWRLGPRINAAGRLGDAKRAVSLLLADTQEKAARLARVLEEVNRQRRALQYEIVESAAKLARQQLAGQMTHALVLHQADWHQGLVGVAASGVVRQFYRPAVLLCTAGGFATGSARSTPTVNILEALHTCKDLLTEYGGHGGASGLTLSEQNVPALRERLNTYVQERMTPEMLIPAIDVDAELDLNVIDARFLSVLKQFAPFGKGNEKPMFVARDLETVWPPRAVGSGKHLKMQVKQRSGPGSSTDVIAFNQGAKLADLQSAHQQRAPIEMVFAVEENTWQGRTSVQLIVEDVREQLDGQS